jgi:hypothetical protein
LLAGVAVAALTAVSGIAAAQSSRAHVMTVQLPGGGVAQIQYTGDVPPQVTVADAPAVSRLPMNPVFAAMPSMFGADSPFAMFDRISVEMDRQMESMLRRAEMLSTQSPSQLTEAGMRNLPAGSQSYSFVSTLSGDGVCTRSVQITSSGNGAAPKVVSHSSGNCGPDAAPQPNGGASGPVNLPTIPAGPRKRPDTLWINNPTTPAAPAPTKRPDTLWVKSTPPIPYTGTVQQTASRQ